MREFDLSGPITLQAKIPSGLLSVTAEPRETATVEVEPYENTESAREAAERTVVSLEGDTLVIEGEDRWRRRGKIRVSARVPEDTKLKVKIASADATLTGRYGDCVVDAASGDVALGQVNGWLRAHAASGDIAVERVEGQVAVDTASGDIRIGYAGGEATVQTASGDVVLGHGETSLRVKSASGDVRVDSVHRGDVRVSTASGDVELGVPAGTSVWLDISTAGGTTRSSLRPSEAPASGTPDVNLRVSTPSGDIDLRRVEVSDVA